MLAHIHPDTKEEQTVGDHLQNVANYAKVIARQLGLEHLAYIAGILHDLGKWRYHFEQYLRKAVSNPASVVKGSVNHSSAGAIYLYKRYNTDAPDQKLTAQIMAYAILAHHGVMDCIDLNGKDRFHERIDSLTDLDYEEVMKNFKESGIQELDACFQKAVEKVVACLGKNGKKIRGLHELC